MSLAAKLPYDHPYAGGYPGIGSQPLPTDADAIDYLSRMATADGAGVEVGVATAVDAFFRDAKESGVFDALKACCILAGARTLAGALVPVVGDAPTSVNFVSGDYSRTVGLTSTDGTERLNANRQSDEDPQDSHHFAVYLPSLPEDGASVLVDLGVSSVTRIQRFSGIYYFRCRSLGTSTASPATGFVGTSRASSSSYDRRVGGSTTSATQASVTPESVDTFVFNRPTDAYTNTISYYSIGTAVDLETLDTAVSNLINRLKFAILVGENPSGLDPDTIDYIVRGYEAGGTLE